MPPSSSSSFIPKRNPTAQSRAPRQKNFFLLSILSYSLFIAAPLASVGVFIYQLQVQKSFAAVVKNLDTAISSFNQSDYDRLLAFHRRLAASQELVNDHVSVTTLLQSLGNATANTVQFKTLELTRKDQKTIAIKAELRTPALDGALYQRSQYDANAIIDTAAFSDVKLTPAGTDAASGVELKAEFSFGTDAVKYAPLNFATPESTASSSDSSAATESAATNTSNNISS